MEIKQGERYLAVVNGYGDALEIDELVILEIHGKFAKTLDVEANITKWRYVTDLETDIVAHLPSLPQQPRPSPYTPEYQRLLDKEALDHVQVP